MASGEAVFLKERPQIATSWRVKNVSIKYLLEGSRI
jgi:hypothetical protein